MELGIKLAWAEAQLWGKSSVSRVMGWVAMRERTPGILPRSEVISINWKPAYEQVRYHS